MSGQTSTPEAKAARTGIVVVGMHRSGTSLAAHLLVALGCHHGGPLMPPKPDNPLGYWEHAEVVDVHDDFLLAMGRRWEDPMPFQEEDFRSPAAEEARRRLEAIFRRDFQPQSRWVLKDPRLCRLLPLWSDVWARSGHEVRFLHVLRSPFAVAESLARRNGFAPSSSYLLWLRHVLESERFTRHRPRAWVELESLVASPLGGMKDALGRLGAADLFDFAAASSALAEVPRVSHVHHRAADADQESLRQGFPWIPRTAAALDGLRRREDEALHAQLDAVAAEIVAAEHEPLYAGAVALLAATAREHVTQAHALQEVTTKAEQNVEKLIEELGEAKKYVAKLEKEMAAKNGELDTAGAYARHLEQEIVQRQREIERLSATAPTSGSRAPADLDATAKESAT